MADPLTALNRVHVVPVMTAAGFSRKGRTYWRAAANGDQVFVALGSNRRAPGRVRFNVRWSVLTITQWQWWSRNDPDPGPPNPNWTWSLTNDVAVPGSPVGAMWSFAEGDDADRDRCGTLLAETLREDVVPWLVRLLDRDALLAELGSPTRPWMPGMSGREAREIVALLGHGPRAEIERRLPFVEKLSPEHNFDEWVRARLDAS